MKRNTWLLIVVLLALLMALAGGRQATSAQAAGNGMVEKIAFSSTRLGSQQDIYVMNPDGSKVLAGLLPPRGAEVIHRIEPFGLIIVLLLMLPPLAILWTVMEPLMRFFMDFFYGAIRDLT